MKEMIDSLIVNNQANEQAITQIFNWVLLTSGAIIGWCFKHFKVKAEIQKLKSEIQKLDTEYIIKNMEINERIIIKRNDFNEKGEQLKRLIQDCLDSITERKSEKFKISREVANDFYFHKYFSSFTDYFDIYSSSKINDPTEKKHFVEEKVLPFLRTTSNFLETINYESLISRARLQKIIITKETMQYLMRFSIDNLNKNDKAIKDEVKNYLDKICNQ